MFAYPEFATHPSSPLQGSPTPAEVQQKGHTAVSRGKECAVSLLPKMSVETVVADSLVETAIKAISTKSARENGKAHPASRGHLGALWTCRLSIS